MRIIIDNAEIFRICISIIFYQLYFTNFNDYVKISEFLSGIFENIFKIEVNNLINDVFNNPQSEINIEKDLNYMEIIENIKNKNSDPQEIEKFYNIEILTNNINDMNKSSKENIEKLNIQTNQMRKDSDHNSEISLTPSLQSQDTGKTYKEMIILDEEIKYDSNKNLFLPVKDKNYIVLYANENLFVLLRYIFCVYERINKLYEYSIMNDTSYFSGNPNGSDYTIFKNFIIIYKALIHKKVENSNIYEELCRDILGNESCFLFSLDKLINSVILFFIYFSY